MDGYRGSIGRWEQVLTAIVALGGLTLVLASLLVVANARLRVEEDPRIDTVEELLPHTNCGACGYPGCRAFAEALVAGAGEPAGCTVSSPEGRSRIADFLGVAVGTSRRRVARLACAGGSHVARQRARYTGLSSCAAAAQVAGGGKSCFWGCLGLADCADACDFDAIHMDPHGLPVVDEAKCTACGDCVLACPKDLFTLEPENLRLWVACRSLQAGDGVLDDCEVGCTACGRCALDAPDVVRMEGALPVVDAEAFSGLGETGHKRALQAIHRCPTGSILWLDPKVGPSKGPAARKIVRRGIRPAAPT